MVRKPRSPDLVRSLLMKRKIASLNQLKKTLGTSSTMTVFRKLKALQYRSSYSHRGMYYTLVEIADFDEWGLWAWHGVWFSQRANMLESARHLVEQADAGLTARELENMLHVQVKQALRQRVGQKQIDREKMGGVYVYLARDRGQKKNQRLRRRDQPACLGHRCLA